MRSPRRPAALLLTVALVLSAGFLLVCQTQRFASAPQLPTLPIPDITAGIPLFEALKLTKQPDDRLGIWGWAASIWVRSGLLPATREPSTEFALYDWGPNHYYRRRHLATLRQSPPEFFLEAVGPSQILFKDREVQGMRIFPELAEFINATYTQIFDDGNNRLFLRSDLVQARLLHIEPTTWRDSYSNDAPEASASMKEVAGKTYFSPSSGNSSQGVIGRLELHTDRPVRALIINFIVNSKRRENLHLGISKDAPANQCDSFIVAAADRQPATCIIALREASSQLNLILSGPNESAEEMAVGSIFGVYTP